MSRIENSVVRFEELVRPSNEAWNELLVECKALFSDCDVTVVYGLPTRLINCVVQEIPGFLSKDELGFEQRLSEFFHRHHSVGLQQGQLIKSCLFVERTAMRVSREDYELLGWGKCGLSYEAAIEGSAKIESRAALLHDQAVAFAGWLVTNPLFLTDVACIRERRRELVTIAPAKAPYLFDSEMNMFCSKWQLAGMPSWDLPEPQGPNLSGIELPESTRRGAEQVSLEIPLTMRLPARLPIRDIVAEISNQITQPHLSEWQKILEKDSDNGPGLRQFRKILQIQFFRNVVLASRYGNRFKGNVEALDRTFGNFIELGEDSVKKLRLVIERRLGR